MAKLVLFGKGDIAQIAALYFATDSEHEVVAFTLDEQFIEDDEYEGRPMVPFQALEETYPPGDVKMFIALSYGNLNKLREAKYHEARKKGYELVSYVSSRCTFLSQFPPGDNCFIFEDNTIQPFVKIGSNVTLWSGNHIGHHSEIRSHNFVSSHVVLSGHCTLEENCFLGVNSTIGHGVTIAKETLVAAGAMIVKNTEESGVYVPPRSTKIDKKSRDIEL